MSSTYDELIVSLKNECNTKNLRYKKIIRTLNRYENDEIILMIEIINDENIINIIENIIAERIVIANNIKKMYHNLSLMNHYLEIFNKEPQTSLTKARKLFKTKIFINIYDFNYGQYNRRTNKNILKEKLQKYPEKMFPLKLAKEYGFQHLLISTVM
jgi:hypothetical protein